VTGTKIREPFDRMTSRDREPRLGKIMKMKLAPRPAMASPSQF
jgi:hypothetical protein